MKYTLALSVFVAFLLSLSFVSAQTTPETIHTKFGGIVSSDLTEFVFRFSVMVDKTPEIMTTASFQNREVVAKSAKSNILETIKTEYYVIRNETYTTPEIVDYEKTETIREYLTIDEKNNTKEAVPSNCIILSDRELSCYTEMPIYKDVEKTRVVYELFDMANGLEPGVWYDFEVRTHKQASVGDFAIDIIPTVSGYDLPYAWYNTSWSTCRNITYNSYMVGGNLVNFPSVVILDNSTGAFAKARSDYGDIRFVDGGCNQAGGELFYELENYTAKNTTFHVSVNLTNTANKLISVYYGNSAAATKSNPDKVWINYALVIHNNQSATGKITDSSPNHIYAETKNMATSDLQRGGLIDGAVNMAYASNMYINVSDSGYLNFGTTTDFTYSAFIYPKYINANGISIINKQRVPSHNEGYYSQIVYPTGYARCGLDVLTTVEVSDTSNHSYQWAYVVCVAYRSIGSSQEKLSMYVNGVYVANASIVSLGDLNNNNPLFLGEGRSSVDNPMDGLFDEARIRNGIESPEWINATYLSFIKPSAFYTFGAEDNETFPSVPNATANVTAPANITYVWDLGAELPVITQYCAADGYSFVTVRGRYSYSATGELYFVNQTDIQTCQYGCADSVLNNLGYAGCKESTLTYALIFIFVVIGVVLIVRFISGGGG